MLSFSPSQTIGDDNGKTTRLAHLLHKMLEEVDEPQLMEVCVEGGEAV